MGAGSWGTAFAMICCDAGSDVVLWARRGEVAEEITARRTNSAYLPDIELPKTLRATTDPQAALAGAEIVVLAVPSHALRENLSAWSDVMPAGALKVSLIKGIELSSHMRASEVIATVLDVDPAEVLVVSGPNLARECAQRMPSGSVAAGTDDHSAERLQAACHTPYFRVYTNTDLVGVELGGAVKNPLAIAAGMADGMGYGDNTKATIVTRGLAELTRLGVAMGGRTLTFSGLAGMGDLVATCMSRQSRNRHVGEQLGRGRSVDQIVSEMRMVAEGVKSAQPILDIARSHGVEMPIVEQVVKVVTQGQRPEVVAQALLGRDPKPELYGMQRS